MTKPKVSIRVVRADGGPEKVTAMSAATLTCGRAAEIALPDDPFIADVQARFFFSNERLAIEDVGGGNGVFLRLRDERELVPGIELRIGRQRLVVESIPKMAPTADGTISWGSPDAGAHFRLVQMFEGGVRANAYCLKEGDTTVGREVGDMTFPTDGFVSGKHAVLKATKDKLTLRDLGSSNGTFIRLGAASFVDNGDQFLMGRELLRVEIHP